MSRTDRPAEPIAALRSRRARLDPAAQDAVQDAVQDGAA